MLANASMERFDQFGAFLAGGASGQVSELFRIRLPGNQRLEDGPSTLAEYVREDAPELQIASSKIFWLREECCEISRTSCFRVRVKSRNSWIGTGGRKLARISPCVSRSAIRVASFTSVLRPRTLRMCRALASTSSNCSSSKCHTGFQYTPVASIATWLMTRQPLVHLQQRGSRRRKT